MTVKENNSPGTLGRTTRSTLNPRTSETLDVGVEGPTRQTPSLNPSLSDPPQDREGTETVPREDFDNIYSHSLPRGYLRNPTTIVK